MSKIRRIASHYLLSYGEMIPKGMVCLDDSGMVVGIERVRSIDGCAGVEFYDGIITAGMVNAHCHLELSHMAGLMRPGMGYAGFAKGMGTLRETDSQTRLRAAAFRDAAMWQQGVQAVGDISNGDSTFGIKRQSKIHYHTFVELFGFDDDSAYRTKELYGQAMAAGLSVSVTPHATYSLSKCGFRNAVEATRDGLLSIHFMESKEETGVFDGSGEIARWYDGRGLKPDFRDYGSPTDRIMAQVPCDRKILLVHNTELTEEDARRLAGYFDSNLTWVVCPQSNLFITGGWPPLEVLRNSGCNIAVGTDSMASNGDMSMVAEMRALQRQGATLCEVLEWSTLGGAKALGTDDVMGSIEEGKRPGIVALSGIDWQTMALTEMSVARRIL